MKNIKKIGVISTSLSLFAQPAASYVEFDAASLQSGNSEDVVEQRNVDWLSCSRYGNSVLMQQLLDAGVDRNITDNQGRTALFHAANSNNIDTLKFLLARKLDIEARTTDGKTPLTGAASFGYDKVVKLLIEYGSDINARDEQHRTALMHAIDHGHKSTAELLLQNGADLSLQDVNGESALTKAAKQGNVRIVLLLLIAGAHETCTSNEQEYIETLKSYWASLPEGSDASLPVDKEHIPLLLKAAAAFRLFVDKHFPMSARNIHVKPLSYFDVDAHFDASFKEKAQHLGVLQRILEYSPSNDVSQPSIASLPGAVKHHVWCRYTTTETINRLGAIFLHLWHAKLTDNVKKHECTMNSLQKFLNTSDKYQLMSEQQRHACREYFDQVIIEQEA